jgi:hypothetical protein
VIALVHRRHPSRVSIQAPPPVYNRFAMLRGCLVALWVGLGAAACGGDVVVDGDQRGTGTSGPDDDGTSTGSPGACVTRPDVVGTVDPASCVSTLEQDRCVTRCNDDGLNTWSVHCNETSCQCQWNGDDICLCVVSGSSGSICGGDVPACCPEPWMAN